MLDILKILLNILSEIQNTIMEKYINLFHIVVGIIFVLIPSFIANKIITNAQLLYGLEMIGAGIIIVHSFIILLYHFNKVKEMADEMVADDDTTNPPSTTGAPVMEGYKVGDWGTPGIGICNGGACAISHKWNPLQFPCCDTCSKDNYNYWSGKCIPFSDAQKAEANKIRVSKGLNPYK
jgi:hypothetical protein